MPSSDTLTDYSAVIRAEIERELIAKMPRYGTPTRAGIGYLSNTHHGYPLYADGDMVAGLRVCIDPNALRGVWVS